MVLNLLIYLRIRKTHKPVTSMLYYTLNTYWQSASLAVECALIMTAWLKLLGIDLSLELIY